MSTFIAASRLLLAGTASVVVAAGAALVVDRIGPGTAALVPLTAAAAVAVVFWSSMLAGLLAFGLFMLLAQTIEHWLALDLLLFDEFGLLLLVAISIARARLEFRAVRAGWLELSLGILAAAAILSSLANEVPLTTWVPGLYLLLKGFLFFELVRFLRLQVRDVEALGTALLGVTAVVAGLGFVEWFGPTEFQRALGLPVVELWRDHVPVIKSVFLHPAQFGWLTAFGSLLLYARFLTHRTWWALPAAVVLNVGTLLSARRTPLLGVVAAVAAGLAWWTLRLGLRQAAVRIWAPALLVAVVASIVLLPSVQRLAAVTVAEYGPSIARAGEVFADEPDAAVLAPVHPRIALYAGSVAVARDHVPLGGGIGRFGSHLSREDYSPLYVRYGLDQIPLLRPEDPQAATDAYWPMVLGETGVVGMLAALAFLGGILIALWRAATNAGSAGARTIALAALFVFIEGLVRSATSSVYVAPPISYLTLGTAAAALSATRTAEFAAVPAAVRQSGNSTTRASTTPSVD